jgi:hypothetical protein
MDAPMQERDALPEGQEDFRLRWKMAVMLGALVWAAYLPALNNGFISDDYVILERAEHWKHDLSYLFSIPPEGFRGTMYLCFALIKTLVGYRPAVFYAFTIFLHFANCLLLFRLVARLTGRRDAATTAAILFAVVQDPQEAVMWLSAMTETLLGSFALLALLSWNSRRYIWAIAACCAAMFSKESGVIVPLLIVLTDQADGRLNLRKQHFALLIPTAAFAAFFLGTMRENALAGSGLFGFHFGAAVTWIFTLHRMSLPWPYLALLACWRGGRFSLPAGLFRPAAWVMSALLPYIWITYQNHLPSRHQYLAAAGMAWVVAHLLTRGPRPALRPIFLTAFVLVNIGYLWLAKDKQYVMRAAPTQRLVGELQVRVPQRILLRQFPLNPWIARDVALSVPGWRPELISVNGLGDGCTGCLELVWDDRNSRYRIGSR